MNDDKYIPKHASFNDLNRLNNIDSSLTEENKDNNSKIEEVIIDNNIKPDNENTKFILEQEKTRIDLNIVNNNSNDELPLKQNESVTKEETVPLWDTSQFKTLSKSTTKTKGKIKRRLIKIFCFILLIVFLIIFSISVLELKKWSNDNKETTKIIENIQNEIEIVEVQDNETTELVSSVVEEETSDYWYYTKFSLIDVDITKLKEKNSDTVGWINVNNTNVNYPYVQNGDNNFYLDHSYDKTYNDAGWVFMDYRNNSNLDNKNTILYAHSRLDDSMFGSLSETLKSKWYKNKDNHIIRISTETENSLWQIFSIYKIKEESYYITTDFSKDEDYLTFLNTIKERSIHNFNTTLNTTDKILTLSTCYSDDIRTVVHAKLIKKSIK